MHDARLVSDMQRLGHLSAELSDVSRRQQPVLIFLGIRQSGQVGAENVLAGDVRPTVHLAHLIRADNVPMLELRGRSRFPSKPFGQLRRQPPLMRTFDRHVAVQLRIVGPKDFARGSAPQSLEQLETPEGFDHRRSLRRGGGHGRRCWLVR